MAADDVSIEMKKISQKNKKIIRFIGSGEGANAVGIFLGRIIQWQRFSPAYLCDKDVSSNSSKC